jgi:tetratricopeptide (TPR) repeat protein
LGQTTEAKEFLTKAISKYTARPGRRQFNNPAPMKLLLASIFDDENNYQEALALCASIVQEYQQDEGTISVAFVMKALLQKASILSKLGLPQEEINIYDETVELGIHKVDSRGMLIYQAYIATAMVNKAITLSKLGRSAEALHIANDILSKFNANIDQAVIEQTTKAAKLKSVLER